MQANVGTEEGRGRRLIDRRWTWPAVLILAFLVTRLAFLDRDLPPWDLAMYQPIDEIAYVIPAFNLHHYGTWTHLETASAPVEGSPVTVLQSLLVAGTTALDWSYWGFRLSSVLLGLVAFAAMLLTVRRIVLARRPDGEKPAPTPLSADGITAAAALLVLFDFSFLLSGRVVEPTTVRIAVVATLLWLVARGTLLGPSPALGRSFALGTFVGIGVFFVYIYNLFLIPGILLAVAVWAWRSQGVPAAVRHVAVTALGIALGVAAYFVFVLVVYGEGPAAWYSHWIGYFRDVGRATGITLSNLWTLFEGNVFRLDRPLMVVTLLMAPVYAWWSWRSRNALGLVVFCLLAAFGAETAVQSDYPERKMLILLPLALPIVAGGLAAFGEFRSWVTARRLALAGFAGWTSLIALATVLVVVPATGPWYSRLSRVLDLPAIGSMSYRVGAPGTVLAVGAIAGLIAAIVLIVGWRRPMIARLAASGLLVAALGPLVNLDRVFVYTNVTTTFRDAMIDVRPVVDGQVTAGSWSFAMQLYNSSRPVLPGYVFGMSTTAYESALVQVFAGGRATSLFGYADAETKAHLESLGFHLVETYPIILPKDRVMGRYVFG